MDSVEQTRRLTVKTRILNPLLRAAQFGKPPILVIGHGRSGTTWIGDTLAKAAGALLYHEPCNPFNPVGAPVSPLWFRYVPPGRDDDYFHSRLHLAFTGQVDELSSTWFQNKRNLLTRLTPGYQIIVKDVASVASLEWVVETFAPRILCVVRHPCAVVLSEYKRDIDSARSLEYMLNNDTLTETLTPEQRQAAVSADTPLKRYAVIWALRNIELSRFTGGGEHHCIAYESVARNPVESFRKLYSQFGLPWTSDIEAYIAENSSFNASGHYTTARVSTEQVDKWRQSMTRDEVDEVRHSVLPFKLGFYDTEESFRL